MGWQKGHSGNPRGRPPGTGKAAELRELLEPRAPELVQKAIDMALDGDVKALQLCISRLIPELRSKDCPGTVPGLDKATTLTERARAVMAAAGAGLISPSDAQALNQSIATAAKVEEVESLKAKITELEARLELTRAA